MQLPTLGQNKPEQQYYYPNEQDDSKKKMLLLGGGVLLLVVLLVILIFSGGNKAGQQNMQSALQSTSDALGIIDSYESKLQYTPTKNDVALTQILLRGNFQKLNTLYLKTYKPKKKFGNSPRPDKVSVATLDKAERNNTLDTDILTVLNKKVESADKKLVLIKPSFSKASSKASIQDSITDMQSIEDVLSKNK